MYRGKPKTHEIISLKETLGLAHLPLVIEAIDISSLAGGQAIGSVVVFREGVADKSQYRKFRIKEVKGIDDYSMMREVVRRRYARLLREHKGFPDLIIVDGGKGHAQAVQEELDRLGITVSVVGIAKKNEELWFPEKGAFSRPRRNPLRISPGVPCLYLIQRMRDEAHRFARAYHTVLRRKGMVGK